MATEAEIKLGFFSQKDLENLTASDYRIQNMSYVSAKGIVQTVGVVLSPGYHSYGLHVKHINNNYRDLNEFLLSVEYCFCETCRNALVHDLLIGEKTIPYLEDWKMANKDKL